MKHSKIVGVGHYLPPKVVTNADLEAIMETSDAWIQERSGIKERRFVKYGEDTTAGMGTKAAKMALERANLKPEDVDFIVFATLSSDYFFPGPGVLVQRDLGIPTIGALDVRNQCSGFIYALSVADQFIKTGMYKTILVIGSEVQSAALDMTTRGRGTAVLFGDGAGAVVLQAHDETGKGLLSTHLHSEGQHAEQLYIKNPGTSIGRFIYEGIEQDIENTSPYMNGNFVFKHAITRMSESVIEAVKSNGLGIQDIDMLVPHQANLRITQMVARSLKMPEEKTYSNIQRYGNTTAATIPICLSELWEQGRIKEGQIYALSAFGSGFTWASALIRW